ncbi:MAG: response regulator [Chitinivibrionales bacterium]|nr:response regulator [Chitinivibrionales bacterium]
MAYSILIVDDSDTIRAVLERTLHMTKLPLDEIIHAGHGREALNKLNDTWVDIIFTDINMPHMNGIELIDNLKKNAEYAEIPVVIISTEGSTTRIEELKKKGIQGYLRKPFTPENVRDAIIETLGGWDE